jgi:hypothetical protein
LFKQLIEPELTWEEEIERGFVIEVATAQQLGHEIWRVS